MQPAAATPLAALLSTAEPTAAAAGKGAEQPAQRNSAGILLNQAFFAKLYIDEDSVQMDLAEPFKTLLGPRRHGRRRAISVTWHSR